jgi:hypothetical protein
MAGSGKSRVAPQEEIPGSVTTKNQKLPTSLRENVAIQGCVGIYKTTLNRYVSLALSFPPQRIWCVIASEADLDICCVCCKMMLYGSGDL